MSAPEPPPDHSLELARMDNQRADRAAQQERKDTRQESKKLANLRSTARSGGQASAEQYFTSQGVDPDEYQVAINQAIRDIARSVPKDDTAPGAYYDDVGAEIYGQEETGARTRAQRELDRIFAPNFETSRVTSELDDPAMASILSEQRGSADDIIMNMLKRGVITQTGYDAASKDLTRQMDPAKARLEEIGSGQLATGRSKLRDVANKGRSTAAKMSLGSSFDPYSYSSEADREFDEWLSRLGGNIRAQAPTDLFSTGSLASVAGQGQGAQNTRFDPNALAGIIEPEEEEEEEPTPESIF